MVYFSIWCMGEWCLQYQQVFGTCSAYLLASHTTACAMLTELCIFQFCLLS